VSPARQRRMQRRIRHEGGFLSVCGDEWPSARMWWISTGEIDATMSSEGVSFADAVELLQAAGCPVCRAVTAKQSMN